MKTKNIFKTLVLAAVLVSACSKNEIDNDFKGYTLPVTINVTRQGDAATRATYDGESKKLSFSTGDKLFVQGSDSKAGEFAGLLAWQSEGTFSGTIMTENKYDGTAEELLSSATDGAEALLIPAGYKSYEYFELDDIAALTKAAAVEQFSFELAETYSSGFTLSPQNAIVSFTISGLTANKEVAVSFDTYLCGVISKSVTTSAEGVATFAIGLDADIPLGSCTLTVDGNNIAMPTKTTEAGHIYNISRPVHGVFWNSWNSTDISGIHTSWEGGSVEIGGITFACDGNVEFNGSGLYSMSGDISFTSSLGNIKKIEIKHSGLGSWYGAEGFDGWPSDYDAEGGTFTWEGTPVETVKLPENTGWGQIEGITSIVFTLE